MSGDFQKLSSLNIYNFVLDLVYITHRLIFNKEYAVFGNPIESNHIEEIYSIFKISVRHFHIDVLAVVYKESAIYNIL